MLLHLDKFALLISLAICCSITLKVNGQTSYETETIQSVAIQPTTATAARTNLPVWYKDELFSKDTSSIWPHISKTRDKLYDLLVGKKKSSHLPHNSQLQSERKLTWSRKNELTPDQTDHRATIYDLDPDLSYSLDYSIETHTNNHVPLLAAMKAKNEATENQADDNSRHYHSFPLGATGGSSSHKIPFSKSKLANAFASTNYLYNLVSKPQSGSSNPLSNQFQSPSNANGLSHTNGYTPLPYYAHPTLLPSYSAIRQTQPHKQSVMHQHPNPDTLSYDTTGLADLNGGSICGKQQVNHREPRIVGGNTTYEGEFPWAVSIQRHGNHHCGGVIVGRRWILTAAHCVRSQLVGNLLVRTGGHTLSRSLNNINSHLERDYPVDQIIMHGDFSKYDNLTAAQMKPSVNANNADIALLKLRNDIEWNEMAWPVCFPAREAGNFSGHEAVVIGWGKLNEKSDDFSNDLQKVKLTIIDNKVCQNWFRQAGRDMLIDERIICAGFKNGGKDACHGDSGGPLLSKINGQFVVVGVVSTGIGCARPLLPGLYSRVSSYTDWIERHVM